MFAYWPKSIEHACYVQVSLIFSPQDKSIDFFFFFLPAL